MALKMRKSTFVAFATYGYLGRRLTAPFFAALFFLATKEGWITFVYGTGIIIVALIISAIPWVIDYKNGDL